MGSICLVYIDDVVVWGSTAEQCLQNVKTVVELLRSKGLLCNGEKCCLLTTKIELLGHIIERGRIRPQASKLEPLRSLETPKTVRDVQKVLGVLGYFRKFVRNYSDVSRPIYEVIKRAEKAVGGKLTPV